MRNPTLAQHFFDQPTVQVANRLLGQRLVSRVGGKRTTGIIVETEAYLSVNDPACHGTRGKTRSNQSMFGPAGHAYVYPIHSRHCFNIVTGVEDEPTAVLIRALQPESGLATMKSRRAIDDVTRLTSGPGCLCESMGIDRLQDGISLTTRRQLWLEPGEPVLESEIRKSPRIGVTSGESMLLRFVVRNSPWASGPKKWRN